MSLSYLANTYSTLIDLAIYDKGLLILNIGLNNKMYYYLGVTEKVWNEFKTAESKGQYFNQYIKDRYKSGELHNL